VREQLGVNFQADNGLVFGKGGFVHILKKRGVLLGIQP
jgi:hypothetical protein